MEIRVLSAQASQRDFDGFDNWALFGTIWTDSVVLHARERRACIGGESRCGDRLAFLGREPTRRFENVKLWSFSVWGRDSNSAGNEGLTDHSSRDLYGIVAPLPSLNLSCALDAGKGQESLSGGCRGAKPPSLSAHAQSAPFTCQEPDKCE